VILLCPTIVFRYSQDANAKGALTVQAPWLKEDQWGPMFEDLLWEKPQNASAALHALQGSLFELGFPAKVLEGTMLVLYQEEIVEDQDFLDWASNTTDVTPGKPEALAQLPRFLQMVRQMKEQEDDDEEEDEEGDEEDDE